MADRGQCSVARETVGATGEKVRQCLPAARYTLADKQPVAPHKSAATEHQVVSADWERRLPGAAGRAAEDGRQARRDRFSDGTGRHTRGATARGAKGYERGENALPGRKKTQEARSERPITPVNHPSAKGRPVHFTVAGGPLSLCGGTTSWSPLAAAGVLAHRALAASCAAGRIARRARWILEDSAGRIGSGAARRGI